MKVYTSDGLLEAGNSSTGVLIIHRRKTMFAMLAGLHIAIDGVEMCALKVDESASWEIEEGEHTIQTWLVLVTKSKPFKAHISAGRTTRLEVYVSYGLPWNLLRIENAPAQG